MIKRLLKLPKNQSFFLFGPRGTGKSTLIAEQFDHDKSLWLDLLDTGLEAELASDPEQLKAMVAALPEEKTHIVLDEVQKIPRLLDVVHSLIESTDKHFILTGSSARKLKQGGANLLAGRAFVYHLSPFSYLEIEENFDLTQALQCGTLPKISHFETDDEKQNYLRAYAHTYLKEEVWAEQVIKELEPFRKFLEVSAQANGKIVNYSNIARDVGVKDVSVKEYFSILEDTMIGFFLEPFVHSFRKRLSQKPKFYYFDPGVVRALSRTLTIPLQPSTMAYGNAFEHFIIVECMRLAQYHLPDFRFSYLRTKGDAEIDLVVERPGLPLLFIEIKSTKTVREEDIKTLKSLAKDMSDCEAVCFSNDRYAKRFEDILVLPWQEGIQKYFT